MIERTQPVVKGIDAKGELVWAVIPMPRWQMEMFRKTVNWLGEFIDYWIDVQAYEKDGEDFFEHSVKDYFVTATEKEIRRLKHFYPKKKRVRA